MELNKNSINNSKQEDLKMKFGVGYEAQKPNYLKEIVKWIVVIIISVLLALLLRAFVFEWVIIQGQSMENTIYNKQVLFINKIEYSFLNPKRGDIVIIQIDEGNWEYLPLNKTVPALSTIIPGKDEVNYIKRIIGLPGDVIDIKDGYVYVNDQIQNEPYVKGITERRGSEFPKVVPEDSYFVMGDNRECSKDSRSSDVGFIEGSRIKGKAAFRIRPLKEFGSIYD